jgi:hypothetical protein
MSTIRSLHLRVQEMCDCYAANDPLQEMSKLAQKEENSQEAAIKWLALAVLHGINSNAKKIAIQRDDGGQITVKAKYRTADLPAPDEKTADAVFKTIREITHIEDMGKLPLTIGIRDGSIDLEAQLKVKPDKNELELKFK